MAKQGFKNTAQDPYVYQEITASTSSALGLDNADSSKFKIKTLTTSGATPTGTAQLTIDSSTNGNVTLTANGAGIIDIATSLTSTGYRDSVLSAGVAQTDGSGVVSSSNGSNGQLLIGGGSAPAWASVTSGDGSITITPGPNTLDLEVSGAASNAVFLAYQATSTSGGIGGAGYLLGTSVALTTIVDPGSNFFVGNGSGTKAKFTAPSQGKYLLSMVIAAEKSSANILIHAVHLITTNRTYAQDQGWGTTTQTNMSGRISSVCDMDIGDTATYFIDATSTANVTGSAAPLVTFVSGCLAP